jgi:mannosyl-oligosaccharide alpha-1,2-mannosidase
MYEHALAASKEYLLFRPMINDTANMTFSGTFDVKLGGKIDKNGRPEGYLNPKTGHLNCFVGGMVGLAARAFGHEEDMELAEQLAESCAWAYRITASGVMPEDFTLLPCPKPGRCEWNETYWKHELDPAWASREGMIAKWGVDESERIMKQEEADKLAAAAKLEADNDSDHDEKQEEAEKLAAAAGLEDEHSDNENHVSNTASKTATSDIVRRRPPGTLPDTARVLGATHGQHPKNDAGATSPSKTIGAAPENNFKLTFPKPLTHEQFVQGKITREKLYPGVTNMNDKRYLLRPEAIESIFYLHRLTGNPIWRRHGWDMFLAVERLSRTALAYSSVLDVTMPETPYHQGVMESFWTAETLKYFWLLFEGEEVMDLGEWVLNTEAHGFRLSI